MSDVVKWIPCEYQLSEPHALVMIAVYDADGNGYTDVAWRSENPAEHSYPHDPDGFLMWVDNYGVRCLSGPRPHRVKFWANFPKPPVL